MNHRMARGVVYVRACVLACLRFIGGVSNFVKGNSKEVCG